MKNRASELLNKVPLCSAVYLLSFLYFLDLYINKNMYDGVIKLISPDFNVPLKDVVLVLFLTALLLAAFINSAWLRFCVWLMFNIYPLSQRYIIYYAADIYFNFLLFYSIFAFSLKEGPSVVQAKKINYYLFKLQISYFYFLNGAFKLTDTLWVSGDGMSIFFSANNFMTDVFLRYPFSAVVISYLVLALEIFGSILLWTNYSFFVIFLFVVFHFAIGFLLNMPFFAAAVVLNLVLLFHQQSWRENRLGDD